jgi:methyl-accepting chemotaxis protein
MWSRFSLMSRIMLLSSVGILFIGVLAVFLNRYAIRETAMEGMIEKSRAITVQALNNMNYVAELRTRHQVMDDAKISEQLNSLQGRTFANDDAKRRAITQTGAYWSIPVVAAWTVAQRDSEASDFEFRTPRVQARNPKNEADPIEKSMLDSLRDGSRTEAFVLDEQMNAFRYVRPVHLRKDCLVCHGTAADDPDGDGYDFFGYKMEGWKEGEVRGGFEIIMDLQPMQDRIADSTSMILLFTGGALGLTLLVVFFATKYTIANPIHRLTQRLDQMSHRTSSAAQQVSSLSQSLAEAATEQAASLEQTSAAMTEIDSQIRDNADNASSTNESVSQLSHSLMKVQQDSETSTQAAEAARQAVNEGMAAMQTIVQSLADINASGQKINDIVELLSSITQQTKMLATNAAVEAARAGEQGKGFGVVADEVAKLAENSKQAAREISQLVNETSSRTQKGNELAAQGEEALQKILDKFEKVSEFIAALSQSAGVQSQQIGGVQRMSQQIREASDAQAVGIDEITKAVHQMDDVTQSNAARAEQTASASRLMMDEASTLNQMIVELNQLVKGNTANSQQAHPNDPSHPSPQLPSTRRF